MIGHLLCWLGIHKRGEFIDTKQTNEWKKLQYAKGCGCSACSRVVKREKKGNQIMNTPMMSHHETCGMCHEVHPGLPCPKQYFLCQKCKVSRSGKFCEECGTSRPAQAASSDDERLAMEIFNAGCAAIDVDSITSLDELNRVGKPRALAELAKARELLCLPIQVDRNGLAKALYEAWSNSRNEEHRVRYLAEADAAIAYMGARPVDGDALQAMRHRAERAEFDGQRCQRDCDAMRSILAERDNRITKLAGDASGQRARAERAEADVRTLLGSIHRLAKKATERPAGEAKCKCGHLQSEHHCSAWECCHVNNPATDSTCACGHFSESIPPEVTTEDLELEFPRLAALHGGSWGSLLSDARFREMLEAARADCAAITSRLQQESDAGAATVSAVWDALGRRSDPMAGETIASRVRRVCMDAANLARQAEAHARELAEANDVLQAIEDSARQQIADLTAQLDGARNELDIVRGDFADASKKSSDLTARMASAIGMPDGNMRDLDEVFAFARRTSTEALANTKAARDMARVRELAPLLQRLSHGVSCTCAPCKELAILLGIG